MNYLLIGADHNNSRDGVIVRGIVNLLKLTDNYQYLLINDFSDSQEIPDYSPDVIVYCGTPYLWHGMERSWKVKNTLKVFHAFPKAKIIWMGIGSCLDLDKLESKILRTLEEQQFLKQFFRSASKIIVRDKLAHEILNQAGVYNVLLPCPAYFCYDDFKTTENKNNVLFFYEPSIGVSSGYWKDRQKLDEYYTVVQQFVYDFDPIVYVNERREIPFAEKLGLDPILINSWQDTLKIAENADYVLSGRVHNAVPCMARDKAVGLLPVDSRAKVVEDFGGLVVKSTEDLKRLKHTLVDFEVLRNQYEIVCN